MKKYSIGQFAKEIGVTVQTLRNWDKTGRLKPEYVAPSGHRHYSQKQLEYFFGLHKPEVDQRLVIGYCRSYVNEKNDINLLEKSMHNFLLKQGKPFKIIKDIEYDFKLNKKGIDEIIDMILDYKVETLFIMKKDQLLITEYEIFKKIFNKYGTNIQIINNTLDYNEQETLKDLIKITEVFRNKLHGDNVQIINKIIKELREFEDKKNNKAHSN